MFNWVVSGEVDPGFGAQKSWRVSVPKNQLVLFGLFIFEILEPSPTILEVSILQKTTSRHDELKLINLVNVPCVFSFQSRLNLWFKPWTNGVASRRKLKTWVYLWLRLVRPCVHLRWLAMTCAHFGREQICMQVKASFSPFGHSSQVNASWVTSIRLSLANEI